jgi:hypothetical protein
MAGPAAGQGVGNLSALPTLFPVSPPDRFDVFDPATGGPISVVLDPQGGPWVKGLDLGPIVAQPGQLFTLHEVLQVGGNLPWTDWHEQFLTPNFTWLAPAGLLVNGAPPVNLVISALPGSTIDFTWANAAGPGSIVDITKTFTYTGPPGTAYQGVIDLAEFPTPEPGTLGLLGLGGLLVGRRRQ